MHINAVETIITISKVPVSVNLDFAPLLLFEAGFESESDDVEDDDDDDVGDVDPDEVETEVFGESVVEDVVESGSASLKILASGEFGGRFKIPENKHMHIIFPITVYVCKPTMQVTKFNLFINLCVCSSLWLEFPNNDIIEIWF